MSGAVVRWPLAERHVPRTRARERERCDKGASAALFLDSVSCSPPPASARNRLEQLTCPPKYFSANGQRDSVCRKCPGGGISSQIAGANAHPNYPSHTPASGMHHTAVMWPGTHICRLVVGVSGGRNRSTAPPLPWSDCKSKADLPGGRGIVPISPVPGNAMRPES